MNNYDDYCTKLFGEHSCTKEDCPTCPSAQIISEHDSDLLDKVAEKLKAKYPPYFNEFGMSVNDTLQKDIDEVITELKADALNKLELPMIPKEFMRERYLQGARGFAEWLDNNINIGIYDYFGNKISAIELLAEWQKGEEHE